MVSDAAARQLVGAGQEPGASASLSEAHQWWIGGGSWTVVLR
jgi:hypothetical protein